MNYTKKIFLVVSLLSEASALNNKQFDAAEKKFWKEARKYDADVKSFGWKGEIVHIYFDEHNIKTKQMVDLIKKCYKIKD